jgi:hypothetical protein
MPSTRLERLIARRTDQLLKSTSIVTESYAQLAEDDAVKYVIGAVQPLDAQYTRNTFIEADRVRDQLLKGVMPNGLAADFRYQGSVTSNTHIRVHSDIDLLAIHPSFYSLEPPLTPSVPYTGDSLADLRGFRAKAAAHLAIAFPTATVDTSRGKALGLTGGSLRRKVDIVIANWWHTVDYESTKAEVHRGVRVYDAHSNDCVKNKPFLHNERIDRRDTAMFGGLRKVIRLLKSLKYDAEKGVPMSSYDITSIAYRMPDAFLALGKGQELQLLANAEAFLRGLIENPTQRATLMVPNDMRTIFGTDGATEGGLRALHSETVTLLNEIEQGLRRSFRKLAEARIAY